ncbi:hypothetical protein FKM82_002691 [Ascaphus truei]
MEGLWILRYRRQLASCVCAASLQETSLRLQELHVLSEKECRCLQELGSLPQRAEALLDTLAGKGKSCLQELQSCIENSHSHLYLRMRNYDPVVRKHLDSVGIAGQHPLLAQLGSVLLVEGLTDAQLQEHDIVQLELGQGGRGTPKRLPLEKLLTPLSRVSLPPRITLTLGLAGAGKSTLVRLFVERWARGELCPGITCVLALSFWEMNVYDRLSAERLARLACPRRPVPPAGVLLILDGLDELRAPLDFSDSVACTDPLRELPPECLITNILRGNLLPEVCVWVTSRPGAAARIPGGLVDRMTEIPGLGTDEVRGLLEQLLPDANGSAELVWKHLQCHRSLQALCSVPALCRIMGVSLGFLLRAHEPPHPPLPKTLSGIFSWYLKAQLGDREGAEQPGSVRRALGSLGRLAFQGLLRRRTFFYEPDLKSCGIDTPLSPGSLCARLLLHQDAPSCPAFCFPHLSLQEFLAAIHYHSAAKRAIFDLFADGGMSWPKLGFLNHYKSAVQRTVQPDSAQLPIFLRFLSGLLSPQVSRLLAGWLPGKEEPGAHRGPAADYLQSLLSAERTVSCGAVNLVCCLQELGHTELTGWVEEAQRSRTLGGRLSPLACCALAYLLRASPSCAQETDLSQCLSYNLVQSLLPQLQYCTNLRLSSNGLGDRGAAALAEALITNSSLTTLDLQSNSISNQGLSSLTRGLSCNRGLKHLNLRENSVSIEGARALAEALRRNRTLTHLDLTANLLHDEGIEALAGALRENQTVESLHLQWNFLRVGSARALADALRVNQSLRCLDLQENTLGDEGMAALSDALRENSALSALYLQGAAIGPAGAQSLAEALMVNTTLTTLDLRGNSVGLLGAKALASALRVNTSLQTLNLQENSIGLDGAICLANAVSGNRSLTFLSLQGNRIGHSGAKVISDTIKTAAPSCTVDI